MTNSRMKGKRGELELVKKLKALLPGPKWRRSQQYNGYAEGGQADLVGVENLHIECKRVEAGSKTVYKWIEQAETDSEPHQIPVVMHKANLHPWLVIIPLDRLEEFVVEVDTLLSKDIPEGSTSCSD